MVTDKTYDWTFTTEYRGSTNAPWRVRGRKTTTSASLTHLPYFLPKIAATDEQIDFELLKQQEKILFHQHLHMMNDDFSDNGKMELDVRVVRGEGWLKCRTPSN